MTTLYSIITEYLETHKKSTETWLLTRFKEYMDKKEKNIHVEKVKEDALKGIDYFEDFLDSLSISETSKNNHRSRMKRFQQSIGLSEVKAKKKRNPENDQAVILDLKKKLTKTERERDEEKHAKEAHKQTILENETKSNEKDAVIKAHTLEKEKECSQCPKTVSFNKTITSNQATFDKERQEYKARIDEKQYTIDTFESNKEEIEEIKRLLTQKTQIEEEIAKGKKIRENERFVKVRCDMQGGSIVSFGNDCMHCNDSLSCPKYYELTNPTRA